VIARESDALHERVRRFIRASMNGACDQGARDQGARDESEGFDDLALAIARFQAAHVVPFARLLRARGVDLSAARSVDVVPAVPTDVFKLARVAAHPPEDDVAVFRTSGTTVGARGEHALRTTKTYELAALAWGRRFLFPDTVEVDSLLLAPHPSLQPDSSLSFMLELFARALSGSATWAMREAALDLDAVRGATREARDRSRPVLVLATSFALVHLLDGSTGIDLRLPAGSRVMQTGGFKGRSRQIAARFGLPEERVVSEYGMTELSSQLYDGGSAGFVHAAPPWVRVTAVDPVSLEPVARGEVGIARVVDLANVDSAVAIQTADRVRVHGDQVELLGRLPGATPRGCSLAADEMLSA
jgi:hypothetical protein